MRMTDPGRAASAPTTAPPLGPPPELRLPAIQKSALANGVPVWIIEQHRVPLVQVNVILRGGSSLDRAGRFGMASLVANMLDEGAGSRSALELADAVEFLGADLSTTSTFDHTAVRLSVPVRNLGEALPLMADVVLRPAFPAAELERLRKERLTALVQAQDNPAAIVQAAFPRVVFGAGHDAVPLVRLAWDLGFSVTIADPRQALLNPDHFPGARLIVAPSDALAAAVALPAVAIAARSCVRDGGSPGTRRAC